MPVTVPEEEDELIEIDETSKSIAEIKEKKEAEMKPKKERKSASEG